MTISNQRQWSLSARTYTKILTDFTPFHALPYTVRKTRASYLPFLPFKFPISSWALLATFFVQYGWFGPSFTVMNSTHIISKCMYSTNKINTGRTTSIYYKNKNKNIRFDIQVRWLLISVDKSHINSLVSSLCNFISCVTNEQAKRQSRAEKRELRMSCHSVIGHSITNPVDYNFQMGTVIGQSSYLIKIIPNKYIKK